jgi:parvulin-like peptidyl-prolyl cis-trans isomerase-like protein
MSMPATSNATQTLGIAAAVSSNPDAGRAAGGSRSRLSAIARTLVREPLVHFVLLGALIFGADAVLHPPAKDDKVITVTKAMRQSFIESFDEDKERKPTDADIQKMVDAWVASEILYREGKTLGVDRGDEMIRDRVAFKLQLLIFDQVHVAEPTDAELRAWFADNHARFDEPERVGFYLTPATDQATARQQLEDIRAQRESEELREQTRAILGRPVVSLAGAFGERFRDRLLAMPQGEWNILQSNDGWHVVRLDSRAPGALAKFEDVKDDAAKMWHTEATRKQAWEAVNRLKANYKIRYEQ